MGSEMCIRDSRTGVDTDTAHGAVMPPLYLSSNYSFAGFDQKRKYDYSRSGNPTRDVLAETLTELEGGAGCVITATGMAAVDLPLTLLGAGRPADRAARLLRRHLSPAERPRPKGTFRTAAGRSGRSRRLRGRPGAEAQAGAGRDPVQPAAASGRCRRHCLLYTSDAADE